MHQIFTKNNDVDVINLQALTIKGKRTVQYYYFKYIFDIASLKV